MRESVGRAEALSEARRFRRAIEAWPDDGCRARAHCRAIDERCFRPRRLARRLGLAREATRRARVCAAR
ncbi:hypothetical protein C7S17_7001 [Burkholderia thailandensis]|nr:hypothetical protein [Burkholderia thailandensis]